MGARGLAGGFPSGKGVAGQIKVFSGLNGRFCRLGEDWLKLCQTGRREIGEPGGMGTLG